MGDMTKEPSMEEILSSIKRIIAEEGEEAVQAAPRRGRAEPAPKAEASFAPTFTPVEEVLELTDEIPLEEAVPAPKAAPKAKPVAAVAAEDSILSVESEVAARHSLSALSSMLVTPQDGGDNTLDGLVRAMLKPMLKEWLDARLPALVEDMVAKEIARITAR
ncbi:MAG: DUF2497 domain-containing protein [Pseudomonadota bacterium]